MTIASSSRWRLPNLICSGTTQTRTVMHHARPPRIPILRSPHNPKQPLPTSGTSHPNPSSPPTSTTSTQLRDSGMTFHHSPPPTAPSYTTGAVPPLLSWLAGSPISLTGEHIAPLRKARSSVIPTSSNPSLTEDLGWSEDLVDRMKGLRAEGKSLSQIAIMLGIPNDQRRMISRFAEASKQHRAELLDKLEKKKLSWGFQKSLARDVRQRRKGFW